MALVKCKEENIRAIAEAIRLNPNFTDTYKLEEMPEVIKDYIKDYQGIFDYFINSNRRQLKNIQLPINITKIRDYAFNDCINLTLTELPENLTYIGVYAFNNCTNLALTELPKNLINIESNAFNNCTNLALTELPENLTNIEYGAFNNCTNLKILTFKGTPQSIKFSAFSGCENLTTINVPWSEGEVSGAPWGATNATINYNYIN